MMQTDMMSKVLNMIYESFKRSLMRFNAVDIVTILDNVISFLEALIIIAVAIMMFEVMMYKLF